MSLGYADGIPTEVRLMVLDEAAKDALADVSVKAGAPPGPS